MVVYDSFLLYSKDQGPHQKPRFKCQPAWAANLFFMIIFNSIQYSIDTHNVAA